MNIQVIVAEIEEQGNWIVVAPRWLLFFHKKW